MYKINPDISLKKIGSEIFVYDRTRAYVHSFNETGAIILEGIQNQLSIETICKNVEEIFEANTVEVENDVLQFIQTLLQKNIIGQQQ